MGLYVAFGYTSALCLWSWIIFWLIRGRKTSGLWESLLIGINRLTLFFLSLFISCLFYNPFFPYTHADLFFHKFPVFNPIFLLVFLVTLFLVHLFVRKIQDTPTSSTGLKSIFYEFLFVFFSPIPLVAYLLLIFGLVFLLGLEAGSLLVFLFLLFTVISPYFLFGPVAVIFYQQALQENNQKINLLQILLAHTLSLAFFIAPVIFDVFFTVIFGRG